MPKRKIKEDSNSVGNCNKQIKTINNEPEKERDAVNSIVRAQESFTIDFYKKVASETKGNFVCSPIGAHTILSMVAYGAAGTSAQAMRKCLYLPKDDDLAHQGFQRIINKFDKLYSLPSMRKVEPDKSEMDIILKMANKIYTSIKVTVKDEFQEIASTHFHSKSDPIDFEEEDESAQIINNWCSKKTCGKINKIISADLFDELTMTILLNAVYFKCYWKDKFDEYETKIKPFYINEIATVNAPMMHKTSFFYYTQLKDLNAQCIALPYEAGQFSMEIVIPNNIDGLKNIEESFEKINQIKFDKKHYIDLTLPKFKVETELDLQNHLSKMGLAVIFSDKANFKNMFDKLSLKLFKPIKVEKVLQKTFIDVNEQGTEATSATYATQEGGGRPPQPIKLYVDRPFLYKLMYDEHTLFIGRVTNPLEK